MPVPQLLMRFQFNAEFLPLADDNRDGIAGALANLSTLIGELATEYSKGEHPTTPVIEVLGVGEASRDLASDRQPKGEKP